MSWRCSGSAVVGKGASAVCWSSPTPWSLWGVSAKGAPATRAFCICPDVLLVCRWGTTSGWLFGTFLPSGAWRTDLRRVCVRCEGDARQGRAQEYDDTLGFPGEGPSGVPVQGRGEHAWDWVATAGLLPGRAEGGVNRLPTVDAALHGRMQVRGGRTDGIQTHACTTACARSTG